MAMRYECAGCAFSDVLTFGQYILCPRCFRSLRTTRVDEPQSVIHPLDHHAMGDGDRRGLLRDTGPVLLMA